MTQIDSKIPQGPLAEKWTNYKNHQKLVNPANKRRLDIIVVGTGLAGASAAASRPAVFSAPVPLYPLVLPRRAVHQSFQCPDGLLHRQLLPAGRLAGHLVCRLPGA